ncbi:hypothetical protein [Cysteiniphilum sp. SYW-8]|nr:hypothetical protein [Cysteiniphilum sp. SYW-8]
MTTDLKDKKMPIGNIKQFPENKISKQIKNRTDNAINKKFNYFHFTPL